MHIMSCIHKASVTGRILCAAGKLNVRTTCKIAVEVESGLLEKIENQEVKPNHHPGIVKAKHISLPSSISSALQRVIGDYPTKTLLNDSKKLNQFIHSRHPPPERSDVREKAQIIIDEVDQKMMPKNPEKLTEVEADKIRKARERVIRKVVAERIYAWKPIIYDNYQALVYAIGRGAQEYAILLKILKELEQRDPGFKPRSYFDFGSGVGTGMWAASTLWKNCIFEYYNIDSSREMNDLSDLIIREGNENQQSTLKNVYFRQFMPGIETKYDLIISSFSLFELPNAQNRKEVLLKLWQKCEGYLVIVEEGSRKGSQLVNEAREYLLSQNRDDDLKGFVFAPCPHDSECPRLSAAEDKTPCNFEVSYVPLKVGESRSVRNTRYSYVVLKKGNDEDTSRQWPRIVRPTLIRSKHVVCRLCTSKGNLQEIIFTQSKHGRVAYRCAKASRWGDRIPIDVGDTYKDKPVQQPMNKTEKKP